MSFLRDFMDEITAWSLPPSWAETARVAAAAVILYLVALAVARTGKKRFLGRNSVLDGLLAIMLGSVLARAINGGATLLGTAVGSAVLVGTHFLLGMAAARWSPFGRVVKGGHDQVVADGRPIHEALRRHHLTMHDLQQAVRMHGFDGVDDVRAAFFERNGHVSIIPKRHAQVVEIEVAEGVQHVRVEIVC